jgi:hypothetical protein
MFFGCVIQEGQGNGNVWMISHLLGADLLLKRQPNPLDDVCSLTQPGKLSSVVYTSSLAAFWSKTPSSVPLTMYPDCRQFRMPDTSWAVSPLRAVDLYVVMVRVVAEWVM